MGELKLYGMRAAYDELMAVAVRRQHEPRQIVGDLLAAEINEKKARSVKYQITTAKLPYAREIEEFTFDDTPINETLVRDLASGEFLSQQRNVVLVGGTGTGKTHMVGQRLQECRRSPDPIGQCRPMQIDLLARVDPGLSVQWKMIAIFSDQHMRQQAGASAPAGDGTAR